MLLENYLYAKSLLGAVAAASLLLANVHAVDKEADRSATPEREEQPAQTHGQAGQLMQQPAFTSASSLVGRQVVSNRGKDIGAIEDLILDTRRSRIAYAVLPLKGILAPDDRLYAVPWSDFRVQKGEPTVVRLNVEQRTPGDADTRAPRRRESGPTTYYGTERATEAETGRDRARQKRRPPLHARWFGAYRPEQLDEDVELKELTQERKQPKAVDKADDQAASLGDGRTARRDGFGQIREHDRAMHPDDRTRLTELVGSRVQAREGQDVGTVEDIMLDLQQGTIAFAILSTEDLGLENRAVAVPWKVVQVGKGYDQVQVDADAETLRTATFPANERQAKLQDQTFIQNLYRTFNAEPFNH